MSKVYAVLLLVVALITMAAIGTLALTVVTDVGSFAYRVLKGYPLSGANYSAALSGLTTTIRRAYGRLSRPTPSTNETLFPLAGSLAPSALASMREDFAIVGS
jgi:hypothetical protein